MRRLPAELETISEGHEDPYYQYFRYYVGQAFGFINRVIQLEAEGRHPVIRLSW